jgi:hypothetical protein
VILNIRPGYETVEHLADEAAFIVVAEPLWRCELRKNPKRYGIDFSAVREGRVGQFVEFKRRHHVFGTYTEIYLSLLKVQAARSLFDVTRLGSLFVVQFDDLLAYADILAHVRPVIFAGRQDRRDWQDEEPVQLVALNEFICVPVTG